MKKQADHPNLNQGGNEGNPFGAGRPKTALRRKLLGGAENSADYWLKVAQGHKVIVVEGFGKQPNGTRVPSHEERGKAFETLLRYGLGTQDEVLMLGNADVFEAFGQALPEFVTQGLPAELIVPILERAKELLGDRS